MKYIAIFRTVKGKNYHLYLDNYTSARGYRLLNELGITLPEKLEGAQVYSVKSLLESFKNYADIHWSYCHALRTAPGLLSNERKMLLPNLDRQEWIETEFKNYIGEPIN